MFPGTEIVCTFFSPSESRIVRVHFLHLDTQLSGGLSKQKYLFNLMMARLITLKAKQLLRGDMEPNIVLHSFNILYLNPIGIHSDSNKIRSFNLWM